jgi:hypothetical protein
LNEKNQMKTHVLGVMILLVLLTSTVASSSAATTLGFGGKSGNWIEYSLQHTISLSGEEQERIDFLDVSGTSVTVHVTYTPSLTGMDTTETLDLTTQDDFGMQFLTARIYFISGGVSQGDSVYLGSMLGMKNITGETTKTYAGVSRRVVYANFSDALGKTYTLYWDKETGVLTEASHTLGIGSEGVTMSATNMWGAELAWLLWISVIAAVALGVLSSRKSLMKRLRRKPNAQGSSAKTHSSSFVP